MPTIPLKQFCPDCGGSGQELPPVSHKDDPQTSKDAERQHTDSGKRATHIELVRTYVKMHPGQSATMIAARMIPGALTLTEVRRRLSDLKSRRLIYNEGQSGRESLWWPIQEGDR